VFADESQNKLPQMSVKGNFDMDDGSKEVIIEIEEQHQSNLGDEETVQVQIPIDKTALIKDRQ
jgi:hypothetical protein